MENFYPISQHSSNHSSWVRSWPISWIAAGSLSIALHGGLIFAAVANAPEATEKRPETKIELLSIPTQKIESRIDQVWVNPLVEKELHRLSSDSQNTNSLEAIQTAAISNQVIRDLTHIEPRNADAAEAVNEPAERIEPRIDTDKALQSVKADRSQSTTPAIPDYSSASIPDEVVRMESVEVSSVISPAEKRLRKSIPIKTSTLASPANPVQTRSEKTEPAQMVKTVKSRPQRNPRISSAENVSATKSYKVANQTINLNRPSRVGPSSLAKTNSTKVFNRARIPRPAASRTSSRPILLAAAAMIAARPLSVKKAKEEAAKKRFVAVTRFLESTGRHACRLALPRSKNGKLVGLYGFGQTLEPWIEHSRKLAAETGVALRTESRNITKAQCSSLQFVRQHVDYTRTGLRFEVSKEYIRSGEPLTGRIINRRFNYISLLLIDDEGTIQDVNRFVQVKNGRVSFKARMTLTGNAVTTSQIILAVSANQSLKALGYTPNQDPARFFQRLTDEINQSGALVDVAITGFVVE